MKTVLVIEDNFDIRENICEILELDGYKTLQAADGNEGVLTAQQSLPDLIICDIMMPGLDGYEVLKILSTDSKTSSIPFIFLTAKAESADFRKGLSFGADDYITKPFGDKELLQAVRLRLQKIDTLRKIIEKLYDDKDTSATIKPSKSLEELLQLDRQETKSFRKKEYIYLKGNRAYYLFYIKKGAVKIFRLHEGGKEFITNIFHEGNFFGYYALIKDNTYEDYAVAVEDSELILIPKNDFIHLIYEHTDIARQFIKLLSSNVAEKEEQLLNMAYDSLKQRVLRTLTDLYGNYKSEESGEARITLTREEVSKYIGTARESFIRIMGELRDADIIEIIEGDIVIKDIQKLSNLL